jgi:hypothetical protein
MASLKRSLFAVAIAVSCSFLAVILATGIYVTLPIRRAAASFPPGTQIGWDPVSLFGQYWLQLGLLATAVFIATLALIYRHHSFRQE